MRIVLICTVLILSAGVYGMSEPPQASASANIRFENTINLQRTTRQPSALVVDQHFIYVADKTGGLYKYDAESALISEAQRINNDFFIAADLTQDNEYLYLADELNKSLLKINKRLDTATAHKLEIQGLELFSPAGLFADKNQDIYLSDKDRDQVYKINALGILEWRRGLFGSGAQNLSSPRAIIIYRNLPTVADSGNNAVKQINNDRLETLVNYPGLLSLAAQQNLLFIGTQNGIYIYPSGEKLDTPQTNYPADMFISDNKLYVLDSQQRKILIYEIY